MKQSQLMDVTGLTRSGLRYYEDQGVIERTDRGTYADDAVAKLLEYHKDKAKSGPSNEQEAREAKLIAEARLIKTRADKEECLLVEAESVERMMTELSIRIRTAVLSISQRVAAERPDLSREDIAAVEEECRSALRLLAKGITEDELHTATDGDDGAGDGPAHSSDVPSII